MPEPCSPTPEDRMTRALPLIMLAGLTAVVAALPRATAAPPAVPFFGKTAPNLTAAYFPQKKTNPYKSADWDDASILTTGAGLAPLQDVSRDLPKSNFADIND